jgi:hypothetical protein
MYGFVNTTNYRLARAVLAVLVRDAGRRVLQGTGVGRQDEATGVEAAGIEAAGVEAAVKGGVEGRG